MSYFEHSSLSLNTIRAYEPRIHKWKEIVPGKSIEYIILFPRQSIRILAQHLKQRERVEKKQVCTMTNLRNYVASILAILRHSPHIAPTIPDRVEYYHLWLSIMNQTSEPMRDRQRQHLPTVIQSNKMGSQLTFEQLIEQRNHLALQCASYSTEDLINNNQCVNNMYGLLLLSMYTYIYPVRADYYATEIVKDGCESTVPNYIRFTSDHTELVIQDFKTAKRYPPIRYDRLPNELHQIISRSLELLPRTYLFQKSNGMPYTRNSFSQWASKLLRQLFGVEMTLTLIRHQFITTLSMDLPVTELERIGKLMGHSLTLQRLYKWHLPSKQKNELDENANDDHE
jgi:hypothetical protein